MGTYTSIHICQPTAPPTGIVDRYGGTLQWAEDEVGMHRLTVSMMSPEDLRQVVKVATDLADKLDEIALDDIAAAETRDDAGMRLGGREDEPQVTA